MYFLRKDLIYWILRIYYCAPYPLRLSICACWYLLYPPTVRKVPLKNVGRKYPPIWNSLNRALPISLPVTRYS